MFSTSLRVLGPDHEVLQAVADVAVESDLLDTAEALVTEGHRPNELTEQCLGECEGRSGRLH